ncbi:MAG: hypothetical protein JOZ08_11820 [Verrucomicrobia bacterium]|nr:hypothetical protein [Verrucomicrobiota bacterium]
MTPSSFQYETPSPLCSPFRELLLIVETFGFVAQPARAKAQTTRILLKRSVKTFLLLNIAAQSRLGFPARHQDLRQWAGI